MMRIRESVLGVRVLICACFALSMILSGCSRSWYRLDADEKSLKVIEEKSLRHPDAALSNFSVDVDPRSRFYDPNDPDSPPMPQDDPEANQYMAKNYASTTMVNESYNGEIDSVENPDWRRHLDGILNKTASGNYLLTLEDAVQIAYLNSPDYQEQRESLYLSAMDLAFERFRFDVQFFGGNDTTAAHEGRLSSTLGEDNSLTTATSMSAERLYPAGGQFAVDILNTFMWKFSGSDSNSASSALSFTFLQPLLRQAGRKVVMERLTVSERLVLANMRAMQRYRKLFYLNVAVGEFVFGGPVRRGGLFGGAGLEGFTGTGGGFGGLGSGLGFGRFGFFGDGGTTGGGGGGFVAQVAGTAGGFIGLVQQQQQLRNQETNIQTVLRELERMEALFEAGRVDALQVDQFRASVQSQLSGLLQSRNSYQADIDDYLQDVLGLPPDLPVTIDDGYAQQFQFFDPQVLLLDERITDFQTAMRSLVQPGTADLDKALSEAHQVYTAIVARVETVEQDFQKYESKKSDRLGLLETEVDRKQLTAEMEIEYEKFQVIRKGLTEGESVLETLSQRVKSEDPGVLLPAVLEFMDLLSDQVVEISLKQARARLETLIIEPIDISAEEAFIIAREHRLDWKNQRSGLVDQWRLINFVANSLETDLDVIVMGDLGTVKNNMVNFRGESGSLSVGLRLDAPITRVRERNQYRDTLIDYQKARRSYIRFVDRIKRQLRSHVRNLRQSKESLELQRRQFVINVRQFDYSRLALREPPPPAGPGQLAVQVLGATTARNLLDSLQGLLTSQNNVMNVWVQYQTTLQQLYRDMEILELDEKGMPLEVSLEAHLDKIRATTSTGTPLPVIPVSTSYPRLSWEHDIPGQRSVKFPESAPELKKILTTFGVNTKEISESAVWSNQPGDSLTEADDEKDGKKEVDLTRFRGRILKLMRRSDQGTVQDRQPRNAVESLPVQEQHFPAIHEAVNEPDKTVRPGLKKEQLPWAQRFRKPLF